MFHVNHCQVIIETASYLILFAFALCVKRFIKAFKQVKGLKIVWGLVIFIFQLSVSFTFFVVLVFFLVF